VRDPGHIAGALGMMAAWRLDPLLAALPALPVRTLLIAAAGDVAVPPSVSHQAAAQMPRAEVHNMPGGHLVHEEAEDGLSALILDWLQPETVSPKII
jgi:magnesium chelatase accessory protein